MAQKTTIYLAGFISLCLFFFPSLGCARKAPVQKTSVGQAPSSEEASADAKLGALSKMGEAEAEKKLRLLDEEEDTEKELAELRKREREEEERRLHRTVTDDRIFAETT